MTEDNVTFGFLKEEDRDFPSGGVFDVKLNRGVGAKRSQKLVHEINYFYFDLFLTEIVPGIWENRSMKENSFFISFKRSRKATK
jgi:hypothetical protein